MELSPFLIYVIPILFACIHFLEFSAFLARISGITTQNNLLGYSIQQAVFVGTRFFLIFLLPLLGLVVDVGVTADQYQMMAFFALLGAAFLSAVVLFFRVRIVNYYCGVIHKYLNDKSFLMSFFGRQDGQNEFGDISTVSLFSVVKNPKTRKILVLSGLVFAIYSTGVFLSFYFALLIPEYRASISQLSGIFNAIGTIILTFFIEPRISRGIDAKDADATEMVLALLIGRFIGVAILGQIILLGFFSLT